MSKIIITENQKKSIVKTVFKYLDENFSADIPWEIVEKEILKYEDRPNEYDIHQDDSGYNLYMYVNCKALEQSLGKDHEELCPYVELPYEKYSKLYELFGPIWKTLFVDWFNTKMENVKIADVYESSY